MKKKNLCIYLVALGMSFASSVYANCDATIQNQSDEPWRVRFSAYSGNVYFSGIACPVNGPCVIPAHTTANIEYTHTNAVSKGRVYIRDGHGNENRYGYETEFFQFTPCPKILHSGATGSVSLNEPHKGSLTIERDFWN